MLHRLRSQRRILRADSRRATALMGALLAFGIAISLMPATVQASHLPAPTGYVNDFAGVIPDDQQAVLEEKLAEFDRSSGNQIAMATVKDLGGGEIADFSVRAFEEWKIGKSGKDNGVLVVAAIQDRKVRIEVGYGLEGSITDAQAGDIIRNIISPAFKQGDYAGGLSAAAGALERRIAADKANLDAATPHSSRSSSNSLMSILPFLLFFGVGILSYIGSFFARSKAIWPGGLVGGVAGGGGASLLHSGFGVIPAIIGFGVLGLLLDYLLSKNYKERSTRGFDTGFLGGGGGFFGGGGSGGGGGFGGFGGGGSGGGGSSGDW